MKLLKFFKPTLATTLAIVLVWLLSVRPVQAGYTVTLQQVGPDVVATGSGPIDLTGLTTFGQSSSGSAEIFPGNYIGAHAAIVTGPTSSSVSTYFDVPGSITFGRAGITTYASSGSGDMVGIFSHPEANGLIVPTGYVSGTALSDTATYSGKTFAQLGVTPGTYVWRWGNGANQNFTLKTLPAIPPATNITNISTRASVQTGENVLIGGFIITGTHTKRVLLRAIGPSLALAGKLMNPTMELRDSSGALIVSNDNWGSASNHQEIANTGAAPTNALESAIVRSLAPGRYTAIVRGVGNTTGIALVEGYDLDRTVDSKFANISSRGFVQTGNNVMIGGFIVLGAGSQKVIIRAIGPSLPLAGKLLNPTLELHNAQGALIASNDNWRTTQQAEIIATGIPPSNNLESAIVRTLTPGAYTAIVRGVSNTAGLALVEVYALN